MVNVLSNAPMWRARLARDGLVVAEPAAAARGARGWQPRSSPCAVVTGSLRLTNAE
jgi:hypothetical protein